MVLIKYFANILAITLAFMVLGVLKSFAQNANSSRVFKLKEIIDVD